ncbi:MAG: protein phosphatase 2C domain-containing protein [Candidatus Thermoplasmatota archaeon]|nr:protein phosphatase 2C domain-containing protein [Candidatus Thermoplasmatota archaeon]MCL5789402.1 protein phosphatase 2C domain-containing protein [Candidatus Thermoplasmatota archaeon]
MTEVIEYGLMSIRGESRQRDEDSALCMANIQGISEGKDKVVSFAAVADGMGSGERGEIASKIAVNTLGKNIMGFILEEEISSSKITRLFLNSVREANQMISQYARRNDISSIGTTLTAALIESDKVHVANIGDSRTYLMSKYGNIKNRTKDHSYVQQLVDSGLLKDSEVRKHPRRNIVTKIMDGGEGVEPDLYEWKIVKNEYVLLCCDGLWEALTDEAIEKIVLSGGSPQEIVRSMVKRANEIDGSDNITAIIMKKIEGIEEA